MEAGNGPKFFLTRIGLVLIINYMKYSIYLLALLSFPAFAEIDYQPYLGREIDRVKLYNPRKSNWISSFGFEAQGLPVERNFQGQGKSFSDKNELLAGGRLGFGREFHLGAGIYTRTLLEGYFVGTLFEPKKSVTKASQATHDSYTQKKGNIWGGEISQSLSFITDFQAPVFLSDHKVKMYFEPFIEGSIGVGKSNFHFDYQMRDGVTEDYRKVIDNTFNSQKLSVGMNFISTTGYFLTIKASQITQQITDSKSYERVGINGTVNRRDLDQKDETINLAYTYYIGGGYKW